MNMHKDYYEILEVHPKASVEIIRKAYLTLAKKYHPDINNGIQPRDNTKMKELNEAYEVISDLVKRKEYDASYFGQFGRPTSNTQQPPPSDMNNQRATLHDRLATLCNQIVDECLGKIVKNEESASINLVYCKKAFDRFQNEVTPLASELIRIKDINHESFRDAMDWCAFALYVIAMNFTWANDFIQAEAILNRAYNNYKPSRDLAEKITSARKDISNSANVQRNQQKSQTDKKPDDSKIIKWIAIAAVLGFFWYIFSDTSNTNSSSSKSPTKPVPTASSPPQPAKPAFIPILDKPTGYDNNFKQLRNNGNCQVTINNSRNNYPVYAKIYALGSGLLPVRSFYLQKNDSFTAEDIPPGLYDVRYRNLQTGNLSKTESFTLEQIPTPDGFQYSVVSFTLYTVSGGNTKMTSIDESQFP